MRNLCGEVDPLRPQLSRRIVEKAPSVTKLDVCFVTAIYLAQR